MPAVAQSVARESKPLFIAFVDITPFTRASRGLSETSLAELVSDCYAMFDAAAVTSGGTTVKFLGDGALLVWPESSTNEAVSSLLELQNQFEAAMQARGLAMSLVVKGHAGTAIAGSFGTPGREQFDIIGTAVMTAARLEARTMALSADAFRRLTPEMRTRFKKHTEPVVYIPANHPRP